jgi:sec-independent protein translocase protein TatA
MIAFLNNLMGPDMLVILLVMLLFFGAKKLPELARGLGQSLKEFKKAQEEMDRPEVKPPPEQPQQKS